MAIYKYCYHSVTACGRVYYFSCQSPVNSRLRRIRRPSADWYRALARPTAWWTAWWYPTSLRSCLQKVLCGLTVDWDLWKWMITVNGSLPPPSEMAEACWLCMVVGYTNTSTSHFYFCLSHSKQYDRMDFFFHSRHLTSFKICSYSKATWWLERSVSLLQTRFIYLQIRISSASVSTVVIWSARASCLKIS